MVLMMSTERESIHTIKPTVQGSRGIKIQAHQAAVAVVVIVMIDAWCASSHRSEREYINIRAHSLSLGASTHIDTRRVYWRVTSNHLQQIAYSL